MASRSAGLVAIAACLPWLCSHADDSSLLEPSSPGTAYAEVVNANYARFQREAEVRLLQKLMTPVSVSFTDAKFGEAVGALLNDRQIPFFIDEGSLADLGISVDDTFSLTMRDVPLRHILDLILVDQIKDATWCIDGFHLLITSSAGMYGKPTTRVYDVTQFVDRIDLSADSNDTSISRQSDESFLGQMPFHGGKCGPVGFDDYDFSVLHEAVDTSASGICNSANPCFNITQLAVGDRALLVVTGERCLHEHLASLFDQLRSTLDRR